MVLCSKKKKNISPEEKSESELDPIYAEKRGDRWTYTAVLPDTGFIQAVHHGKRNEQQASLFLAKIYENSDGEAPLFISDGWFYSEVISQTYCHYEAQPYQGRGRPKLPKRILNKELKYAQVVKERDARGRLVKVIDKVVIGDRTEILEIIQKSGRSKKINTSFVESRNGKYRKDNVRLARKTMCHSKKTNYHDAHIDLLTVNFNYCRENEALKELINPNAEPFEQKYQRKSPAMAEGLCDKILTLKEVLMRRVPQPTLL